MKAGYRKVLVLLGCLGLLLTAAVTRSRAAEALDKPAVVVSIAKIDQLMQHIGYLTRAAGTPEVGGLVTLMAGEYIQGLNTTQPVGAVVTINGAQPTGLMFVAVSDFDLVTSQIEEGAGDLEDVGGGILKLSLQQDIFLKESEGWMFVSNSRDNLQGLPKEPAALLGGLNEKYGLAVQINVQNIPPELREMALSNMEAGFTQNLENETDEEQRRIQETMGRQSLDSMKMLFNETESVTLGWGVEPNAGITFLDVALTAVEGSELAGQVANYKSVPSGFGGLLTRDAAATLQFTSPLTEKDIQRTLITLQAARENTLKAIAEDDDLPNDKARDAAKSIVDGMFDVFTNTVKSGRLDGAAALTLDGKKIQLIAGGFVADGKAVEREAKKLLELAKELDEDPQLQDVRLDIETHQEVNLHTFALPIPDDEEDARRVLGDKLEVALGTGASSIFLAVGNDSLNQLKAALDRNAENADSPVVPTKFKLALIPIFEFLSSVDNDPGIATMTRALKLNPDKDDISLTVTTAERGLRYRIEVQEGVLGLIGQGARMRNEQPDF